TSTPCINGISPASGIIGTTVTIAGLNFGATQGPVTLNGVTCPVVSWSSSSIQFTVQTGATTGNVYVTIGSARYAGVFTVLAPIVTNLNPDSGRAGIAVTIAGSNFGTTQGDSTVKFNGVAATPTSWSNTSIATPVPTGATTGPVTVTVGGQTSAGVNFTFTTTPTISGISPNAGPANTPVTITGSGFGSPQGSSTVSFNGIPGSTFSWSDNSISASVPSGATTVAVTVTAGGVNSNSVTFTVYPPPSVCSLSPTSGAAGSSVIISGSNFGTSQGNSVVRFNGVAAQTTAWAAGAVTAIVPNGASTGPVTVTVSGQTSNGSPFTAV